MTYEDLLRMMSRTFPPPKVTRDGDRVTYTWDGGGPVSYTVRPAPPRPVLRDATTGEVVTELAPGIPVTDEVMDAIVGAMRRKDEE